MKFTIFTSGTRGDVHPFLPLAKALLRSGHAVRLSANSEFRSLIERAGIPFTPVELDYNRLLLSPEIQASMEKGGLNFLWVMLRVFPRAFEMIDRALADAARVDADGDVVLFTPNGPWGYHIAEALRIPAVFVCFQPAARSREVPNAVAMASPGPKAVNWLSHVAFEYVTWLPLRSRINRWRKEQFHLPPLPITPPFPKPEQSVWGAYSPTLSPRPSDWPEAWQVVGAWLEDAAPDWKPPADLSAFLEAGPPPVYLGFGSMLTRSTARLSDAVRGALRSTRQRAVLSRGWHNLGPDDLPGQIFLTDPVWHSWLFPRMAMIIHHGGGGTTAAAVRSGVPSMAVPHGADQPFWGNRAHALGAGPRPVAFKNLTADRLAEAIRQGTEDPAMRANAKAAGEKMRREDGVARAVEFLRSISAGPVARGFLRN
jgi:sterol 3beta-glucosyltransferase